jgi:hypothetical protein
MTGQRSGEQTPPGKLPFTSERLDHSTFRVHERDPKDGRCGVGSGVVALKCNRGDCVARGTDLGLHHEDDDRAWICEWAYQPPGPNHWNPGHTNLGWGREEAQK